MTRHGRPQAATHDARPLDAYRRQAAAWWGERTPRERRLLRAGALVAAAALFWTLGLKPALDAIALSRERLPRLHAEAAAVQALVIEAQALQRRQSGRSDASALPGALRDSLRRAGLADSATLHPPREGTGAAARTWEVSLENAGAARVMEWLADVPHLLRVRIDTVELARSRIEGRDRPGHVSGRIVLRAPAEDGP